MTEYLALNNIELNYGKTNVIKEMSFSLLQGEISCLLGQSGCGKTTILRAIAGLEDLAAGCIKIEGNTISRTGYTCSSEQRNVGMVFQHFALFPHLNVWQNIGFGLNNIPNIERHQQIKKMIALFELEGLEKRYVHQLSGGQKQRVAIARAMAPVPSILLLDEPFSHLDKTSRTALATRLYDIFKHENMTVLWVTHDQEEALRFADKVGFLDKGKLEQWADPKTLYHFPQTKTVASAIGEGSFLPFNKLDANTLHTELGKVKAGELNVLDTGEVLVRPEQVILDNSSAITGKVLDCVDYMSLHVLTIELVSGSRIICKQQFLPHNIIKGQNVGIRLLSEELVLPSFP